jgi:hypothetical protein
MQERAGDHLTAASGLRARRGPTPPSATALTLAVPLYPDPRALLHCQPGHASEQRGQADPDAPCPELLKAHGDEDDEIPA